MNAPPGPLDPKPGPLASQPVKTLLKRVQHLNLTPHQDYKGKYVNLFFYPFDFTFVCPTEIMAFNSVVEDLRSKGAEAGVRVHHEAQAFVSPQDPIP